MANFLKTSTFNGTNGSHFKIDLYYDIYSQNITTNETVVQYDLYAGSTDGYSASFNWGAGYIGANYEGRSEVGSRNNIPKNSWNFIGSRQITYTHNADGTMPNASYYALFATTGDIGNADLSGTIALPTIPRASSIVATDAYVGSGTIININRAVDTFTHTITYSFDGLTGTIASKTSNTTFGWIIPNDFYTKLTNTNYEEGKNCTLTCETFNGNTSLGTKTTTFKVRVDASSNDVKPSVDATITLDTTTNNLTGATDRIIKGMTDATISITATAKNGSSISSRSVVCGDGQSLTGNGTINNVESGNFIVSATDSRGITNSTTKALTLVEYVTLTINPTFYRTQPTNNTIALTFTGNYFNDKFGTASSTANTLTVKYRYKLSTATTWGNYTTLTAVKDGNTYSNGTNPITLGTGFDYTKEYDFEIVATDRITTVTKTAKVLEGIPVFDWGKNDFKFNVPVYQESGNELLDYTTVSGDNVILDGKTIDSTGIVDNGTALNTVLSNKIEQPTVLYNNTSGASGNITLSDSASNYSMLAIVYTRGLVQFVYPSILGSGQVGLNYYWRDGTGGAGFFGGFYTISGTSITLVTALRYYFYSHQSKPTIDTTNNIAIYKVLGYK